MRVYLGRIVELDREPTCEVGPELAIYRSVTVTGCDEHRGRRGEQAAPFHQQPFNSPSPPRFRLLWGLAALDIVERLRLPVGQFCMRSQPQNS